MLLPTNGCSFELCIPFLKLTSKERASISWKPGPLAANVTRSMIDAAANCYVHVVASHWFSVTKGKECATSLIMAEKETKSACDTLVLKKKEGTCNRGLQIKHIAVFFIWASLQLIFLCLSCELMLQLKPCK